MHGLRLVVVVSLLATLGQAAPQQAPSAVGVAVLDSGIDAGHAEFQGMRIERHSFASPVLPPVPPGLPGVPVDPFAQRLDPEGQGTAVASRVAGKTLGRPGLALVDLQVSAKHTATPLGPGPLDPATEAAAQDAMDWLVANHGGHGQAGPRVALLSFATRDLSGSGAESVVSNAERLYREGVLVVVPAGGNGSLHRSPFVLTVGLASASCGTAGPSPAAPLKPDVAGNGTNVRVAESRRNVTDTPDKYGTRTGAQYAAADVAGAAAAVWAARSDLPVDALMAILRGTARDAAGEGPDGCTGFGAVDVGAAVEAAKAWQDPAPTEELAKPSPLAVVAPMGALAAAAWLRRR